MTSFSSHDNVNRIPEKGNIKDWGRNCQFLMNVLKDQQKKTDIIFYQPIGGFIFPLSPSPSLF